jgi:phosphoglycerate dehydrogenase-like enzyme
MTTSAIVLAGTGFRAVQDFIQQAIPDVRFSMIDPSILRTKGCDAEVLIPAMARVDGGMMDRIRGLRLIHQWGAGLEGVDVAAATAHRVLVANVPSAGGNADSVAEWCVMAAIALSRQLPSALEISATAVDGARRLAERYLGELVGLSAWVVSARH